MQAQGELCNHIKRLLGDSNPGPSCHHVAHLPPKFQLVTLSTRSHHSGKVHMVELADFVTSPISNFNTNSECSIIIITWKQNWSSTSFETITFLKHLKDLLLCFIFILFIFYLFYFILLCIILLMPVKVCLTKLLLFKCCFDLNKKKVLRLPLNWQSISFWIEYEFYILVFWPLLIGKTILMNMSYSGATLSSSFIQIWNLFVLIFQVAEVAQILDFLSTQTTLPIVGISGGSAVVIPYKVLWKQWDFQSSQHCPTTRIEPKLDLRTTLVNAFQSEVSK